MLSSTLVVLAIVAGIAIYAIKIYNDLVRSRQMVKEGWSGISVQLKRRFDLIPNMVEAVKGYLKHEREVLENVTAARNQAQAAGDANPGERGRAEGMLGAALGRLLAVVENYPELKANQNVMDLQGALKDIEDQIQMSRRYYNGAVRELNTAVEQFPSNIVANMFHFETAEFFEIENPAEREVPKVSLG
ncbi:MAG: LemA family protein [Burkholderiaceae bacterium]